MRDGDALSREWVAAFGHELRSPLSSILGYAELVADGALGGIDERAADAVRRMAAAADQLIMLLDGVEAAMDDAAGERMMRAPDAFGDVAASALIDEAVSALRVEADSRDVVFSVAASDLMLHTVEDDARRALVLALGAAIKASPNRELRVSVADADPPAILIDGSSLDPQRDTPELAHVGSRVSGGALRLSLAQAAARRFGGSVVVHGFDGLTRLALLFGAPTD